MTKTFSTHKLSLYILYLITLCAVCYLIYTGYDYYSLPLNERPHHNLHQSWKPGGLIGHGVGIIGSSLILILLLYSARKKWRFMQKWGNIRYWLNYHIWMGITGPLLIIFHSSFKVHGIIAVSFWSMVAVALSGVLGRYLYIQIPRNINGDELTAKDLADQERAMLDSLKTDYDLHDHVIVRIEALTQENTKASGGWSLVWRWLVDDLRTPFQIRAIRSELSQLQNLDSHMIRELTGMIRRLTILKRRKAFLLTARRLLHYWHVIHKPFAIVMIVIMFIHVFVTILFGYRWVF